VGGLGGGQEENWGNTMYGMEFIIFLELTREIFAGNLISRYSPMSLICKIKQREINIFKWLLSPSSPT
jgi:hypothetical protein